MSELKLHNVGMEITGRWIVRGVSLAPGQGRLTALVGPNGSGKTTLLRLLAGIWRPSEGTATLDGRDLRAFRCRELARAIAFVPQDPGLQFSFTVRDAVMMGRHSHLGRFERERERDRSAVEKALKRTDVTHLADRAVTELSGGERQRVVIARSLATEAEAILLDEPTANLDIAHGLDVLDLCRALAEEGKTVVLALHDLNAAARYADQVILVCSGAIVANGAPAEVLTDTTIRGVFGVRVECAIAEVSKTAFIFHRINDENGVRESLSDLK